MKMIDSAITWMDRSNLILAFYMVLAYFAIGCFGMALRDISRMPDRVNWFCIIFGFFGIIACIVRLPRWQPPLMVHLPFMIVGIVSRLRIPEILHQRSKGYSVISFPRSHRMSK